MWGVVGRFMCGVSMAPYPWSSSTLRSLQTCELIPTNILKEKRMESSWTYFISMPFSFIPRMISAGIWVGACWTFHCLRKLATCPSWSFCNSCDCSGLILILSSLETTVTHAQLVIKQEPQRNQALRCLAIPAWQLDPVEVSVSDKCLWLSPFFDCRVDSVF